MAGETGFIFFNHGTGGNHRDKRGRVTKGDVPDLSHFYFWTQAFS